MRSTDERYIKIQERFNEINYQKRQRKYQLVIVLSTVFCLVFLVVLAINLPDMMNETETTNYNNEENLGSIFTNSGELEYVLIALIAFWLGVSVTLLCVFLRKRFQSDKENHRDA
jgi:ABC-type spermidine/putrescine transport system permease subunit I